MVTSTQFSAQVSNGVVREILKLSTWLSIGLVLVLVQWPRFLSLNIQLWEIYFLERRSSKTSRDVGVHIECFFHHNFAFKSTQLFEIVEHFFLVWCTMTKLFFLLNYFIFKFKVWLLMDFCKIYLNLTSFVFFYPQKNVFIE